MISETFLISLWITLLGMGSVFGAIFVLWIGMALLVRIAKEKPQRRDVVSIQPLELNYPQGDNEFEETRKRQAAAIAVAYALEMKNRSNRSAKEVFPLPPTAFVSAWQAVMRSNNFSKRGRVR